MNEMSHIFLNNFIYSQTEGIQASKQRGGRETATSIKITTSENTHPLAFCGKYGDQSGQP